MEATDTLIKLVNQEDFSLREDTGFDNLISLDFCMAQNPLGYIDIAFNEEEFTWTNFYPLSKASSKLFKIGIGTLAHMMTLVFLKENYSQNVIKHRPNLMYQCRKKHLEKMGIDFRLVYPFDEYFQKSLEYAESKGFHF